MFVSKASFFTLPSLREGGLEACASNAKQLFWQSVTTFQLWFDAYSNLCHICIILMQVCLAIDSRGICTIYLLVSRGGYFQIFPACKERCK